jgi:hypothetical protein
MSPVGFSVICQDSLFSDMSGNIFSDMSPVAFSVTCLRDPTSKFEFEIKVQISIFQILYSVDWLTQSTNFKNLMESSQTTLLKEKLFPLIWSRSVEIYKKKSGLEVFVSMV